MLLNIIVLFEITFVLYISIEYVYFLFIISKNNHILFRIVFKNTAELEIKDFA